MHHSQLRSERSSRELKQLLNNEANTPWQLLMENREPNWRNAAQRNISLFDDLSPGSLGICGEILYIFIVHLRTITVIVRLSSRSTPPPPRSAVVYREAFKRGGEKNVSLKIKTLPASLNNLILKWKENKDHLPRFLCLAALSTLLVPQMMWQIRLEGKTEAGSGNMAHS